MRIRSIQLAAGLLVAAAGVAAAGGARVKSEAGRFSVDFPAPPAQSEVRDGDALVHVWLARRDGCEYHVRYADLPQMAADPLRALEQLGANLSNQFALDQKDAEFGFRRTEPGDVKGGHLLKVPGAHLKGRSTQARFFGHLFQDGARHYQVFTVCPLGAPADWHASALLFLGSFDVTPAAALAAAAQRLHLPGLDMDVDLPADEAWLVSREKRGTEDTDVLLRPLTNPSGKLENVELGVMADSYAADCAEWQARNERIHFKQPDVFKNVKFRAASKWVPKGWHGEVMDSYGGLSVTACRSLFGSVLTVQVKGSVLGGADVAIAHALAAIEARAESLSARIAARPVMLTVLGLPFTNPAGTLWATEKFAAGGDMIFRTFPAKPEIKMVVGATPNPVVKCGTNIDVEKARGGKVLDGAPYVPASWHQQVARNDKGGIVGCIDLKGAMLTAFIMGKASDGVTEADFASARAVLESLTAAIPADRR